MEETKKKTGPKEYLLSMGIALFSWLILGSVVAAALQSLPCFQRGLGPFLLLFVPYLFLFFSLVLCSRFLLKRPLWSLINPEGFRKGFALSSFLLYTAGAAVLTFLMDRNTIQASGYEGKEILLFIPFVLVLITLQTFSEECFFRVLPARMVYGNHFKRDGRTVPLILFSGIFFLLPHLGNPEVLSSGTALFSILFYFLWGSLAMALGLYGRGFEGILAAHTANNLFVALLVNYQNSALPSRPLFVQTGKTSSLKSLLSLLLLFSILWCLSYKKRRQEGKKT